MTKNTDTATANPGQNSGPDAGLDDPRPGCAQAVATARSVVRGINVDQMELATPCGDYSVRQLLGHLVCAFRRLDEAGRMDPDIEWSPIVVTDVLDDGYDQALEQAAHGIMTTWTNPALLGQIVALPFAEMPGAFAMAIYTAEYLTHAWDLAVATGQTPAWPEELVAASAAGMKMGLPEDPRGGEVPFAAVVPVPDDAPPIHRLVAWAGRDPQAWPLGVAT